MRITKTLPAVASLIVVSVATAHPHLNGSIPAEASVVAAPTQAVFTFSEAARITTMSIQREGEEARKLAEIPKESTAKATIPLPQLSAGKYTLTWRVMGDDGHVMNGTLHFEVSASSSAIAPQKASGH